MPHVFLIKLHIFLYRWFYRRIANLQTWSISVFILFFKFLPYEWCKHHNVLEFEFLYEWSYSPLLTVCFISYSKWFIRHIYWFYHEVITFSAVIATLQHVYQIMPTDYFCKCSFTQIKIHQFNCIQSMDQLTNSHEEITFHIA